MTINNQNIADRTTELNEFEINKLTRFFQVLLQIEKRRNLNSKKPPNSS